MTETVDMNSLPPVIQKFVLHWGEMGRKWGISRTVAQIHALLYTSEKPLHAEEICTFLGVARSNVSNSLKELQNWGIVKVVHLPGDRRDHFESMKDVYEMFRAILAERKRREVDPTLQLLKECQKESADDEDSTYARTRIGDLQDFFQLSTDFYKKMDKLPTKAAAKALRTSDRLLKALRL